MLKHGIVNPLNVHGLRRLDYCPPHFEKFYFDAKTDDKFIIYWILENFQGRFYIGDATIDTHIKKVVAFEDHAEKMLFALQVDVINRTDFFKQ